MIDPVLTMPTALVAGDSQHGQLASKGDGLD
jgi:hypothetical protein